MTTLLIVAGRITLDQAAGAIPAEDTLVDLLMFRSAGDLAVEMAAGLGERVAQVLPTQDLMREVVPDVREKFVRFTADWSVRATVFGRNVRDGFRRPDGSSAWWFTDFLEKNAGVRPTFARLCELEALRLVLSRGSYGRAVLVCHDRDQQWILRQVCERANVAVASASSALESSGTSFLSLLFGRIKRWILDVAATVQARLHDLPADVPLDANRRSIAFNTWFPSQWLTWQGLFRDRAYVDVPDIIGRNTAWQPFYACMLPAPSLRALRSHIDVAKRQLSAESNRFVFLERHSSLWDVCRSYGDVRPALKYWWLESFDARFRASFVWDGIDVFRLLRHDLRSSLVRDLPYFELLARRVSRMAARLRPTELVTMLETWSYGRAVVWGARRADAGVRVVGFQHSPSNANQLMYRFIPGEVASLPLPDLFLLYGDNARRMLEQSGIGADRLVVTGGRRFDPLQEFRRRRLEERKDLRQRWGAGDHESIVLVATTHWRHTSDALMDRCVRALSDRPDTLVLVKPHPYDRTRRDDLRVPAAACARFVVTDDSINELQAAADVMVTASSTVDSDAVAIGCPAIRVMLGDFDLSPTSDFPGLVTEVTTAQELRCAVDRILTVGATRDGVDDFVRDVFFKLDGRSGERVVAALATLGVNGAALPA